MSTSNGYIMISVQCSCGQILRASQNFAGTKVTCPKCRKAVQIPALADVPPARRANPPAEESGPTTVTRPKPLGLPLG